MANGKDELYTENEIEPPTPLGAQTGIAKYHDVDVFGREEGHDVRRILCSISTMFANSEDLRSNIKRYHGNLLLV